MTAALVHIETNALEVAGVLNRLFRDQEPFARSRATNAVAKEAQTNQRRHQRRVFTVRRSQFVDRAIKIKPFSTKRRQFAVLRVEPPGGRRKADIFTKFERGGEKRARDGGTIAVPIEARRTKAGVVSKSQRPRNLLARSAGVSRSRRVFLVRKGREGFILQRLGRGRNARVKLLFALKRSVPIEPRLDFVRNISETVRRRYGALYAREFDRAVRTAR